MKRYLFLKLGLTLLVFAAASPRNQLTENYNSNRDARRTNQNVDQDSSSQQEVPKAKLENYQGVMGKPGVDFPILTYIPRTGFNCKGKKSGYYADLDTNCQVFHICEEGRKVSFLCPNGTIFQQSDLICDWWFKVDCATAPTLYDESAEQLYEDNIRRKENRRVLDQERRAGKVNRQENHYKHTTNSRENQANYVKKDTNQYTTSQYTNQNNDQTNNQHNNQNNNQNNNQYNNQYRTNQQNSNPNNYQSREDYNYKETQIPSETSSFVNNRYNSEQQKKYYKSINDVVDEQNYDYTSSVKATTEKIVSRGSRTYSSTYTANKFQYRNQLPDIVKTTTQHTIYSPTVPPFTSTRYTTRSPTFAPVFTSPITPRYTPTPPIITTINPTIPPTIPPNNSPTISPTFSPTINFNPTQNSAPIKKSTPKNKPVPGFYITKDLRQTLSPNEFSTTAPYTSKLVASTTPPYTSKLIASTTAPYTSKLEASTPVPFTASRSKTTQYFTTPNTIDINTSNTIESTTHPLVGSEIIAGNEFSTTTDFYKLQTDPTVPPFETTTIKNTILPSVPTPFRSRSNIDFDEKREINQNNQNNQNAYLPKSNNLNYTIPTPKPTLPTEYTNIAPVTDNLNNMIKTLEDIDRNQSIDLDKTRPGLHIPPSAGPKTLHSLAIYFATALDNLVSSNETTDNIDELSTTLSTIDEDQVTLLSRMTQDKYNSLFDEENIDNTTDEIHHDNHHDKTDIDLRTLVESDTHYNDLDLQQSRGIVSSTPRIRQLAQVFTQALSAYLDDPDTFKKVLEEIRPTEPPLDLDNNESISTATTEYKSYTKEEDEVLDFSDADKSSTYRPFSDSIRTTPTVFIRSTTETYLNEISTSFPLKSSSGKDDNLVERIPTPNALALDLNNGLKLSNATGFQDVEIDESSIEDTTDSDDYFPFNTGEDEQDIKLKATAKPYGIEFQQLNSTPMSILSRFSSTSNNSAKPADNLLPPFKISLLNKKEYNDTLILNDEALQSAYSQSFVSHNNINNDRKGKQFNILSTTDSYDQTTQFNYFTSTTPPESTTYYDEPTTSTINQYETTIDQQTSTDFPTTTQTTIPLEYTTERYTTDKYTTEKYPTERYTEDKYATERYTEDKYPTERYTEDKYPTERYTTDKYPTERYTTDKYPTDKYPTEKYTTDKYTTEKYPTEKYPTYSTTEETTETSTTNDDQTTSKVPNNHWSTSPEVTKLWETTLYVDPLIINRNLGESTVDINTPTTYRPDFSTSPYRTTTEFDDEVDLRFGGTTEEPSTTTTVPSTTEYQELFSTVIDLGIHTLLNTTELEIASSQAHQIFGNLNSTEQDILIEKMKQAESNSTVRRLILLLVSTCDASLSNNKTVQETRNSILHALLNTNSIPEINSRSGKQINLETTTQIPETTTLSNIRKKSIENIEAPNKVLDVKDVNHDTRALELLRSLYSLAAKWGKK